jgi:hypothetical protein
MRSCKDPPPAGPERVPSNTGGHHCTPPSAPEFATPLNMPPPWPPLRRHRPGQDRFFTFRPLRFYCIMIWLNPMSMHVTRSWSLISPSSLTCPTSSPTAASPRRRLAHRVRISLRGDHPHWHSPSAACLAWGCISRKLRTHNELMDFATLFGAVFHPRLTWTQSFI